MNQDRRPTAARWTAPGRGAIAVIRVENSLADWADHAPSVFQSHRGVNWSALPLNRLNYGRWGSTSSEDVVVCRLNETDFEVHCHGGEAAVARILSDLAALSIPTVTAHEQHAARVGVIQAELDAAVTQAVTLRTAEILLQQADGRWPRALERMTSAESQLCLAWSNFARHLVEPWKVVLSGRPNVGKSSLINALLGYQRAIVNPQPGTTRDVVSAVTAFDGWPVQLSDTAGLRDTTDELESAGIARAREHLADADTVLIVLDRSQPLTGDDRALLEANPAAIVIANKADLPDHTAGSLPSHAIPVSSVTGEGLDRLQAAIIEKLIPNEPPGDTLLPVTARLREILTQMSVLNRSSAEDAGDSSRGSPS